MTIKIVAFGKIADILPQQEWETDGLETAGMLRGQLEAKYPNLKGQRYLIAVDKKIANDDSPLEEHSVVALLPPFSGG
ncbi:MAG: MoaD/ThiS family protein [Saprospiraceae bacterium]|nr:MoaD/ThiS family protein [Saprospiraceae bacterium]